MHFNENMTNSNSGIYMYLFPLQIQTCPYSCYYGKKYIARMYRETSNSSNTDRDVFYKKLKH